MENQSGNGVLEEFRIEFLNCWQRLPDKGFFLCLLASWLALFHFLGNSTLGYAPTHSLLLWMCYTVPGGKSWIEADEAYTLVVPFVVLVLFWFKRDKLLALRPSPWWPGLGLVALGLGLHVLGYAVQQPRISILALIIGIYGLMGLVWGLEWLRAAFFPFFLMAFCIPVGSLADLITVPLRLIVTKLVTIICHFILAIDVEQHGNILSDPSNQYQYEVVAACSGIRSLFSTLLLAVILGFISFQKSWKRLVIIASAFPLAVLGNLLRLLAIVVAAEMGGQEWGNIVHEGGPFGFFSLLPYVPAFFGLLLLEHYLRKPDSAPPSAAETPGFQKA
jgi:exosortase